MGDDFLPSSDNPLGGFLGGGKSSDPSPYLQQLQRTQSQVANRMLPGLRTQIDQQRQYQLGNIPLEKTFMGPTLIGPENLAYKAARERIIESTPEGGGLTSALTGLESSRANQDAAARQQAAFSMIGPPPALGGQTQAASSASQVGGQVAGIEFQQQQMQNQSMAGLGQLLGIGIMSIANPVAGAGAAAASGKGGK